MGKEPLRWLTVQLGDPTMQITIQRQDQCSELSDCCHYSQSLDGAFESSFYHPHTKHYNSFHKKQSQYISCKAAARANDNMLGSSRQSSVRPDVSCHSTTTHSKDPRQAKPRMQAMQTYNMSRIKRTSANSRELACFICVFGWRRL